jgi:hypothetical protein
LQSQKATKINLKHTLLFNLKYLANKVIVILMGLPNKMEHRTWDLQSTSNKLAIQAKLNHLLLLIIMGQLLVMDVVVVAAVAVMAGATTMVEEVAATMVEAEVVQMEGVWANQLVVQALWKQMEHLIWDIKQTGDES